MRVTRRAGRSLGSAVPFEVRDQKGYRSDWRTTREREVLGGVPDNAKSPLLEFCGSQGDLDFA